jgi:hypothetical protein
LWSATSWKNRFGLLPAGRGLPGESNLADARAGGERFARLDPEAVHDVEHARGQDVADQLDQHQDGDRSLLCGLQNDRVACRQGGCQLPDRHQDREVPGDDLADDAQGLMKVIGDRVMVDLAERTFLRADAAGEIAEMIDREWDVGRRRLADRLAVVPGLDEGELVEIVLHDLRDAHEDTGALADGGTAPGVLRGMRRVERKLDVVLVGARDLANDPTIDRRRILEIAATDGGHPFTADEVLVAFGEGVCLQQATRRELIHLFLSRERLLFALFENISYLVRIVFDQGQSARRGSRLSG